MAPGAMGWPEDSNVRAMHLNASSRTGRGFASFSACGRVLFRGNSERMTDKPFMRPSVLIGLAAVVILSACSTTPASSSKPTKYPIYEMSSAMVRPVFPTGDQNLAWLDDERVLFEGLDRKLRDPVETNQSVRVAMRGLYIWNIRTNEV